eukprot:scaffold84161_cov71-Phaeocystis_antarctica.AAC.1
MATVGIFFRGETLLTFHPSGSAYRGQGLGQGLGSCSVGFDGASAPARLGRPTAAARRPVPG